MNDILNHYNLPDAAREDLAARGLTAKRLANDVVTFEQGGHDKGIAYRFFTHRQVNKLKSEDYDIDIYDEIEMIQWFVRKDHKPTERVEFLPEGLLKFARDKKTGKVLEPRVVKGGEYAEAYNLWKSGLQVNQGLPLERWGELTLAELASLEGEGIFTVEQFASLPEERVRGGRFPKNLQEKFEKAIRFVASKNVPVDVSKYADQVAVLKQENTKLQRQMEEMQKQFESLTAISAEAPRKRGRPRKEAADHAD